MAITAVIASFFGCTGESEYTTDDIETLSISCGQMDLTKCYSFGISRKDGSWILYAECFSLDGETEIKLETPIQTEEAENLLKKAEDSGFISSIEKYRKPILKANVSDEEMYSSLVTFSDGSTVSAPILASRDIENSFYSLAEKYGKVNN